MPRACSPAIIALLAVSVTLPACDLLQNDEDNGTAPTIEGLVLTPDEVDAEATSEVMADFTFTDPEGDVESVNIALHTADESMEVVTDVDGAEGLLEGPARVAIELGPTMVGELELELHLIDAMGNESNTLSSTIVATGSEAEVPSAVAFTLGD